MGVIPLPALDLVLVDELPHPLVNRPPILVPVSYKAALYYQCVLMKYIPGFSLPAWSSYGSGEHYIHFFLYPEYFAPPNSSKAEIEWNRWWLFPFLTLLFRSCQPFAALWSYFTFEEWPCFYCLYLLFPIFFSPSFFPLCSHFSIFPLSNRFERCPRFPFRYLPPLYFPLLILLVLAPSPPFFSML